MTSPAVSSWFRSAEVSYYSVILQGHLAHDALEKLGDLSVCQFHDLNPDLTPFQRRYTKFVRRCDELERIIRLFEEEMIKYDVKPQPTTTAEFEIWKDAQLQRTPASSRASLLDSLESSLQQHHHEYQEMSVSKRELARTFFSWVERLHVINKAGDFFSYESSTAFANVLEHEPSIGTLGGGRSSARAGTYTSSSYAPDTDVELLSADSLGLSPLSMGAGAGAGAGAGGAGGGGGYGESDFRFRHLAGVINQPDKTAFERMLFRVSRGNCYVRFAAIEEPVENDKGELVEKVVFIIFFRAASLFDKLRQICDAFSANRHDIPNFENGPEVEMAKRTLTQQIEDSHRVLEENRNLTLRTLQALGQEIAKWKLGVQREKATYHTLNLFEPYIQGMVRGQAWILKDAHSQVVAALADAHAGVGGALPYILEPVAGKWPKPPTHFHTNKFTGVFQAVVNTYGTPRYREVNPALFTAVTFPFLFGVMYGDMGHASVLMFFAAYLCWNERKLSKAGLGELFDMCFKGRYMLLMMGAFGIYAGLIYNDLFAQATNLFGSRWTFPSDDSVEAVREGGNEDVYPIGADPQWHTADNELLFFNSLKMKMSVILGVVQMTFGIFLKLSNAIYFRNGIDIVFEVIPQLCFMLGLFGYMLFLIFFKWSIDWRSPEAPGQPPNLIDTLISIALKPGTVENEMYEGQGGVQVLLLLIAFLSIPMMLLPKPFILRYRHRKKHPFPLNPRPARSPRAPLLESSSGGDFRSLHETKSEVSSDDEMESLMLSPDGRRLASPVSGEGAGAGAGAGGGGGHGHGDDDEEFDFGEVFIHQTIETIEFVLGTVSNTASYLRLWALSLAHSELATVFWEKAVVATVETNNPIMIVVGYAVFAAATTGVLLMMDVLECFLHALRLHWVEFQNKFYHADGYKFEPFSFKTLE